MTIRAMSRSERANYSSSSSGGMHLKPTKATRLSVYFRFLIVAVSLFTLMLLFTQQQLPNDTNMSSTRSSASSNWHSDTDKGHKHVAKSSQTSMRYRNMQDLLQQQQIPRVEKNDEVKEVVRRLLSASLTDARVLAIVHLQLPTCIAFFFTLG